MPIKRNAGSDSQVALGPVVTPMLDMTFQLLFFFVMTFRPPLLAEGKMAFSLPADPAGLNGPQGPGGDDIFGTELTIILRANEGKISAVSVKSETEPEVFIAVEALPGFLRARQLQGKGGIKIAADSRLKYGQVISVLDTCLKAGFKNVGFAAPPDLAGAR